MMARDVSAKGDAGFQSWPIAPGSVLNMSTGPVQVSAGVMQAQTQPLLTPHIETFWNVHDQTVSALGRLLLTSQRVLIMHGSIRTGIDLALGNVVRPGTRVLSLVNGYWGGLIADWAQARGGVVDRVEFGSLEPVDPDRVAEALQSKAYDLVTVVHVETNSGIVNPIQAIGALVKETEALYFVDTACSAGAIKIETDAWHIDLQTTGSHKCLGSIPGLAVVTVSDKAWQRLPQDAAMGTYFGFRNWWEQTMERRSVPPFTQPTTLVHALAASLAEMEAIGFETWWRGHRTVADLTIRELRQNGFEFLLDRGPVAHQREFYSDTVLALRYPDGVDDARFRELLMQNYGIFVIGNVGEFAGKSFRMGLMSAPQLEAVNLYGALSAFRDVLRLPDLRASVA